MDSDDSPHMNRNVHESALCILALGSPHGDDQAGWLVADALVNVPQFQGKCHKLATPWDLLTQLKTSCDQIIIDACMSGSVPGTIHQLRLHQLEALQGTFTSSHGCSLPTTLQLAKTLGYDLSRTVVYAIEIDSAEPGRPVSDAVRTGVDELVERIVHASEFNQIQCVGGVRNA